MTTLNHPVRRAQFLAGHWLLRELLAGIHGVCPSLVALDQPRGRGPRAAGESAGLFVSLSHAEEWIAAAVSNEPIGVDIEPVGRRLDRGLEPLLRHPVDAAEPLGAADLLERWVVKEAYLKARGESALPEQLATLLLQRASVETPFESSGQSAIHGRGQRPSSRVRVASNDACLLAVCSSVGVPQWHRRHPPTERSSWRVQRGV